LSIKYTVAKPIKFISSGEKLDTLDVFYPERMAQRILGMGDITTLVEKRRSSMMRWRPGSWRRRSARISSISRTSSNSWRRSRKWAISRICWDDTRVGKAVKDIDISDDSFKGIEAIIGSMTPFERANPDVIDQSRRKRLALGSGKDINEINAFLKQFDQMKQMMKMMNKMPMGMGGRGCGSIRYTEQSEGYERGRTRDEVRAKF